MKIAQRSQEGTEKNIPPIKYIHYAVINLSPVYNTTNKS